MPFILLIAAYAFLLRANEFSQPLVSVVHYSSYAVFLLAMLISCWFNCSRVFFTSAILFIVQFSMVDMTANGVDKDFCFRAVMAASSILLPLNIFIFSQLKERGILTVWGISRIGFILFQVLTTLWLIGSERKDLLNALEFKIIPAKFLNFSAITQLGLILFLLVFIYLIIKYYFVKSYFDIAFIGIIPAIAIALDFKDYPLTVPVFFSAAGMMTIISIFQNSYSMAFLDELTGLPSRRALRHDLMKLSGKYVIAMLDVDFFKKFNDTYGHDVGDEVLRMVSVCMRNVTGNGKSFRYGGEEFTILFPGKALNDAVPHLDALREAISKRGFTLRGKDRPKEKPKQVKSGIQRSKQLFITVSIGAAERNEKYKTADEVLKASDNALYRAKNKGRNCVSK